MSGLSINLKKSELVMVGDKRDQEKLASVLGCKVVDFPIRYLGLPLGARYKDEMVWDPVIETFKKGLAK